MPTAKRQEVPDLSYGDAVHLKTELTAEIKLSVKEDIRKWILHWGWIPVAVIIAVLTFFGWWSYQGLLELQQRILARATKNFDRTVRERFAAANVASTVDSLIREKASAAIMLTVQEYAEPRIQTEVASIKERSIAPVQSALAGLSLQTSNMAQRISELSASLTTSEARYDALSGDIGLLRLHAASVLGSRPAFTSLLTAATNARPLSATFARTLIDDLNRRYTEFKNERTYENINRIRNIVVHPVTGKEYKSPAEIFRRTFDTDRVFQKQTEIDSIADRRLTYFVEDLVRLVDQDPDLYVASRAVSALERLTDRKFSNTPLFTDVGEWWQQLGKTNVVFKSPFPLITEGNQHFKEGRYDAALKCYCEAVTNRHGLAETHFNMALSYLLKRNEHGSTNQLALAIREADGQSQAMLTYASILLAKGSETNALAYIRNAIPFIQDAKRVVGRDARFAPLRGNALFRELIGDVGEDGVP